MNRRELLGMSPGLLLLGKPSEPERYEIASGFPWFSWVYNKRSSPDTSLRLFPTIRDREYYVLDRQYETVKLKPTPTGSRIARLILEFGPLDPEKDVTGQILVPFGLREQK